MVRLSFLLGFVVLPVLSMAQSERTSMRWMPAEYETTRGTAHGSIDFNFTQYSASIAENPKLNQSQLLSAGLQLDFKTTRTSNHLDFSAGKYLDLNNSTFSVQEMYSQMQFKNNSLSLAIGRKLEFWSQVDSDWQLGLWEPKYNSDSLRPVNQGLSGLFLKSQNGKFEFLGYASAIFVPTVNPDISEKNGELKSDSRWYKSPSPTGSVLDKDTKLFYSISMPELSKLVLNPGAGLRLRYGGQEPGFWASANYSRKPINSLFIKYDYNLALQASGSQAEIAVSPTVSYHRLYGADFGWLFDQSAISVSYLTDEPETERPENEKNSVTDENKTDWIKQEPGRVKIAALHAQTRAQLFNFVDPVELHFDYLKAEEKETHDIDAKGEDRGALFPYRLNFTNAASVKAVVSTRLFSRNLVTSFRYLREFDQAGSLWSLATQYFPTAKWSVSMGADILGVDDGSVGNTDKHFLNQFRANDRIFGGLSYVF